ncbi:hypothetical protein ACP26L_17665 [Paenibacillus sp. S-38]|uniref:hypothetical protein n=1 Tax=Paenibacillus sp. S-38 TaxID=3416710 RepID=UPI003CEA642B
MQLSKLTEVKVRTDLGIDPHIVLDYELKYRPYLELMKEIFHGYISFYHFAECLSKLLGTTPSAAKYVYRKMVSTDKMVNGKWLKEKQVGKYKFAYLKWKAIVCLTKSKNYCGDYDEPSTRQIVRSLLLGEHLLKSFSPGESLKYRNISVDIIETHRSTEQKYAKVIVLDITSRNFKGWETVLGLIRDEYKGKMRRVDIDVLCYSPGRLKSLEKWLDHDCIKEFKEDYRGKIFIKPVLCDITKFFNGSDPIV